MNRYYSVHYFNRKKSINNRSGFTLIELMIIIIVIFLTISCAGVFRENFDFKFAWLLGGLFGCLIFPIGISIYSVLEVIFVLGKPYLPQCKNGKCISADYAYEFREDVLFYKCKCGDYYKRDGRKFIIVNNKSEKLPYLIWVPLKGWCVDEITFEGSNPIPPSLSIFPDNIEQIKNQKQTNVQEQNLLVQYEMYKCNLHFVENPEQYHWLLQILTQNSLSTNEGYLFSYVTCIVGEDPENEIYEECDALWITTDEKFYSIEALAWWKTKKLYELEKYEEITDTIDLNEHHQGTGVSFGALALSLLHKTKAQLKD